MSEFEDNFISHRQPPVDVGGDEDEDLVTSQAESSHDFDILDNEPLVDSTQNDGDLNHPVPDSYDYDEAPTLSPAAAPGSHYDPTVSDIKEEVEPEPETPVHREPSPSPEEPSEADTTCSVSRCEYKFLEFLFLVCLFSCFKRDSSSVVCRISLEVIACQS